MLVKVIKNIKQFLKYSKITKMKGENKTLKKPTNDFKSKLLNKVQ